MGGGSTTSRFQKRLTELNFGSTLTRTLVPLWAMIAFRHSRAGGNPGVAGLLSRATPGHPIPLDTLHASDQIIGPL